ncbi:hypothetical protein FR932_07030 [Moritella marina ATCC 15381]|uniref:Uncharacterized protein n=1 Tax=Moritella marina ATCC 15381 TaxID=1202962 RepID=A0A5J6WHL3_MORMI|nr:hypothetical protein [Moritella marina]QFI37613.1 hypothetical protein FR932_07030 [Moritella marina ATCC 15381]
MHSISLCFHQTATLCPAADGAALLANAIKDESRQFRPADFNALVLWVSSDSSTDLAKRLAPVNEYCPLAGFVECGRYAASLATLDSDKLTRPKGTEQSLEWTVMNDKRSIPVIKRQYQAASLAQVNDQGQALISDVDSALAECKQLKGLRDARLTATEFNSTNTGLNCMSISANTAKGLADKLQGLGDDKAYWAFCAFVGNSSELEPIKELFL